MPLSANMTLKRTGTMCGFRIMPVITNTIAETGAALSMYAAG